MPVYTIDVLPEDNGKRLDLVLLAFVKNNELGISRTGLQKLILTENVRLNDAGILKANHKVRERDRIVLIIDDATKSPDAAENIPLDIIYEDDDVAVINKQAGIVVHPAPGNKEHTLVNALLFRFKTLSSLNPARPGIVHRLDKETSGILVIAKNNVSHLKLAEQFSEHTIKKKYVALVKGEVEFDENLIDIPIGRHPTKRKSMSARYGQDTKYAQTYYRVLKRFKNFTFLELKPHTGRTHQLRVHLAFLGHPILGDKMYGTQNDFSRLALHAFSIGFIHPSTAQFVEFYSPVPQPFEEFMKRSK